MTAEHSTCSVPTCERKRYAFGFCFRHYEQHRRGIDVGVPMVRARRPNGGGSRSRGYHVVMDNGKLKAKHIVIAEQVLGRPLKKGEQVHHWNRVRDDNTHSNLLICTAAYHRLIHMRMDAIESCVRADWRKCKFCKAYDDPAVMIACGSSMAHRDCENDAQRRKRAARKLQASYSD